MQLEVEKITPSRAKEYLAMMVDTNRKKRLPYLDRYKRDIINGKWIESTGESIKFDRRGKLFDGQHRLTAIIETNISLRLLVARNCDPEAYAVVDTGAGRSAKDTFVMASIKNASSITAGIKVFHFLEDSKAINGGLGKASSREMLHEYRNDQEFWDDVQNKSAKWYKNFNHVLPSSTFFGFYAYIMKNSKHKSKIVPFFDELTGDLVVSTAVKTLKNRLIQSRVNSSEKLKGSYITIYIIKAWNAYVRNRDLRRLSYDPDKEQFPAIE